MDDHVEFLTTLPQKNNGKRDRGYYRNQRQRIIKKRMYIAKRKRLDVFYPGELAKGSIICNVLLVLPLPLEARSRQKQPNREVIYV